MWLGSICRWKLLLLGGWRVFQIIRVHREKSISLKPKNVHFFQLREKAKSFKEHFLTDEITLRSFCIDKLHSTHRSKLEAVEWIRVSSYKMLFAPPLHPPKKRKAKKSIKWSERRWNEVEMNIALIFSLANRFNCTERRRKKSTVGKMISWIQGFHFSSDLLFFIIFAFHSLFP